ncbi:RNase H family protein [Agromyces humatus]|uniref:Ribonuclease H n=1 Tax=Agromyces humatus TaxID=279573 RepID=A0ABP4WV19_9MICO|nr:RNase H family protein [Agromyces humatus]
MIIAAADGSALGNPGPAGWAWYVDDDCWDAGGWKHATNNQGELKAVLELFRATAHLDDELLVLCDSQYVINAVTKWMAGWKRKGWRKADGKPVMNLELLQELDAALASRAYRFEWVKGHVGHPLNEAADERARAVAEAFQRGAAVPSGPGWTRNGGVAIETAALVAPDVDAILDDALDDAGPDDALFALDDLPAAWHTLTVELSTEEHDRLLQRARAEGRSPEDFLRGLI